MNAKVDTPEKQKAHADSLIFRHLRDDEPAYAKLNDPETLPENRYGNPIQLIPDENGQVSLKINGVDEIGSNPNRNKQHAFHFTADNCIGCHACEAACSEKNDLPPHLSFRSVGYVEGGSFPNFTRMNISMACNHCDNPVCLKGCPTRAYTKHPEYGAVIQDPDICFGCGYCTWVCPYNAPQLDPVAGQVEKCNMCVDRLEVGLKPACVSACLGNALNFGVVENTPENREQIDTRIPGFPDPSISQPNIRFQQTRTLPREMGRTDSMPIKYKKDNASGQYKTVVDQKAGKKQYWGLNKLSSRENPLVIFTLATQAAIGTVTLQVLISLLAGNATGITPASWSYAPGLLVALGLISLGLLMSAMHLGKPMRFYRGFNNWRHSPVAREGLGAVAFMAFTGLHLLATIPAFPLLASFFQEYFPDPLLQAISWLRTGSGLLAIAAGITALYYMYRCYCIKARPFWNHWQTATSFYGNMLSLGGLVVTALTLPALWLAGKPLLPALALLAGISALGIFLETIGLAFHGHAMNSASHEGAASHYIQCTSFGKTYYARNALMVFNLVAMGTISVSALLGLLPSNLLTIAWLAVAATTILSALVGRALFYVLVIPTTMPGAFFWRNKAFEQHARDLGFDQNPASGVAPLKH